MSVEDHAALINALGGNSVVAKTLGCKPVTVGAWKRARRIPPEYWPAIIEMAQASGLQHINPDWLLEAWQPRQGASEAEAA